ncbi:MAG: hypothetical protein ACLFV7_14525, partial [Phycisphaerae bacterium]
MTTDIPLVQLGPGGEYARPWPDGAQHLPQARAYPSAEQAAHARGLQPPLVHAGCGPMRWVTPDSG